MNSIEAHRCWAEIDLAALRHNARVARQRLGGDVALLAVIKANGYGHGLQAVADALRDHAQLFGVANLLEAIQAREVVPHPVMILGPALASERAAIVERRFIPTVSTYEEALEFSRVAQGSTVAIHCAIDTGMGRIGLPESDAVAQIKRIAQLPKIEMHSISTHLPSADEDAGYTAIQLSRFHDLVEQLRSEVRASFQVHALNSAGVLAFQNSAHDMVRTGLMIYGVSPIPEFQTLLKPALTLKGRIALLRELPAGSGISYGRTFVAPRQTRVATLSFGYADGFPRSLSNRDAAVLIRGCRCSVLGRVTMDLTLVDVTELPDVAIGDEVVVIGRQGEEQILATEVAERAGTIAWEVFTGIGSRVARVYV
ncbi:MAG: alanine racemase [Chthoniobacterales bacterium]